MPTQLSVQYFEALYCQGSFTYFASCILRQVWPTFLHLSLEQIDTKYLKLLPQIVMDKIVTDNEVLKLGEVQYIQRWRLSTLRDGMSFRQSLTPTSPPFTFPPPTSTPTYASSRSLRRPTFPPSPPSQPFFVMTSFLGGILPPFLAIRRFSLSSAAVVCFMWSPSRSWSFVFARARYDGRQTADKTGFDGGASEKRILASHHSVLALDSSPRW